MLCIHVSYWAFHCHVTLAILLGRLIGEAPIKRRKPNSSFLEGTAISVFNSFMGEREVTGNSFFRHNACFWLICRIMI